MLVNRQQITHYIHTILSPQNNTIHSTMVRRKTEGLRRIAFKGWLIRRFLGIPNKRSSKINHYESSADLINVLVEDTELAWVLALNKDCLQSIKQGVREISNHLVSESQMRK